MCVADFEWYVGYKTNRVAETVLKCDCGTRIQPGESSSCIRGLVRVATAGATS